ncbi:MAG: HAMP domain-containing sensor histidine kinase [Chloroflexota bacterium]
MNSLKNRLYISYAVLAAAAFSVAVIVVMVLFAQLSLPDRQINQDLTSISKWLVFRPVLSEYLPDNAPHLLDQAAADLAEAQDVRVMLLHKDGRVIVDSGDNLIGFNLFESMSEVNRSSNAFNGSIRPQGTIQRWLLVGRQIVHSGTPDIEWIVVARQAHHIPLFQVSDTNLLGPILVGGLVGLLAALVGIFTISRSIAKPFEETAAVVHPFLDHERLKQLDVSNPSEARAIVAALETLSDRVQVSNLTRRGFLSNITRDLGNPLTEIIDRCDHLLAQDSEDEELDGYAVVNDIRQEAARIQRTFDGLVLLSELDRGDANLQNETIDLGPLLENCVNEMYPQADFQRVSIDMDYDPAMPLLVSGDYDRLMLLFNNLISESINSSNENESIDVRARADGERLVVVVGNSRATISPSRLSNILGRFFQGSSSDMDQLDSVELDLVVSAALVKAHGGTIRAESVAGSGANFTVTLPSIDEQSEEKPQ